MENNIEITSFKHVIRGNIIKKQLNGLFGGIETEADMLNKNACVNSGHYSVYSIKKNGKESIVGKQKTYKSNDYNDEINKEPLKLDYTAKKVFSIKKQK